MPFNQVQEGQENRGDNIPDSRIYPARIAGQKIEGAVEIVVMPLSGGYVQQAMLLGKRGLNPRFLRPPVARDNRHR